ncbi:response regulator [Pelagicoccus mobilis]|uniref:Response regulator n=1 Tax=Pelagicoccus mobilis TaxID=415221 RepID=A0A934RS59_9BACT|nr:response regulator [Pelagicoccus mobilis]MBK1875413.1 response regulator [Pelagicoccus mobilis]
MTPQHNASSNTLTALLAEDDTLIRELVAGYLNELGYIVKEAPNGADALQLLDEDPSTPFDLIVTDLLMPKASGDAVIEHARKSGACNRFLVMSGNPFDAQVHSQKTSPDSCFLEKPFTFGDFEAKLNRLENGSIE